MTHRSWRTENIKNAQADGIYLLSCKDLKIWHVLPCFILYFQCQEWASLARWTVKLAVWSVWCLLYLVLSDDPIGLRWFSPLQNDLLLISAALKRLQRNRTRHCGNHHSHTPQKLITLSETFKKAFYRYMFHSPGLPVLWIFVLMKRRNTRFLKTSSRRKPWSLGALTSRDGGKSEALCCVCLCRGAAKEIRSFNPSCGLFSFIENRRM